MKTLACVMVGLLALGSVACTSAVTVRTAALETAPFSQFHTYAFSEAEPGTANRTLLGAYVPTPRAARAIEIAKPAIAEVLDQKGYALAPAGESDITIVCTAGRRNVEGGVRQSWRATAVTGGDTYASDYVEGAFVIDVFDKRGGAIWHGAAQAEIDPNHPDDARLQSTVRRIMAEFPSRPGK